MAEHTQLLVVDAFEVTFASWRKFMDYPRWLKEAMKLGVNQPNAVWTVWYTDKEMPMQIFVNTPDGPRVAHYGDYIVLDDHEYDRLHVVTPTVFTMMKRL